MQTPEMLTPPILFWLYPWVCNYAYVCHALAQDYSNSLRAHAHTNTPRNTHDHTYAVVCCEHDAYVKGKKRFAISDT